ncbi:glycosyltransferase family 4 protein [Acetobacterium sp.]|uniref:glycosyltransferase family 4 protein n=1 Tax=Acetobacterium sp. TaxID=1872094 RepID=UPI002F3EF459
MKNAKWKIGIWGQFGDGGQIADGQAVKTTIIANEIKGRYNPENVKVLNTNNWKGNPISFFIKSIMLIVQSKKVIIFPADNGFKVIVPLLSIVNLFYKREVYYVVIGGFLFSLLQKNKIYINPLKKFKAIFVETNTMKKDLESLGIDNIYILFNLKRLEKINESDLKIENKKNISVCTFSRVSCTKGIEDAIEGVRITNQRLGDDFIQLDIYGMVNKNYEEKFKELLAKNQEFVTYKGVVDYDKTVDTLRNYFALIFPTYFDGEGFPGSVIDSYYSGLPIIATNWLYNKDIIDDGFNGILVPIKKPEAISKAILKLYNDREMAFRIAVNNVREAEKYTPSVVLEKLFMFLDK